MREREREKKRKKQRRRRASELAGDLREKKSRNREIVVSRNRPVNYNANISNEGRPPLSDSGVTTPQSFRCQGHGRRTAPRRERKRHARPRARADPPPQAAGKACGGRGKRGEEDVRAVSVVVPSTPPVVVFFRRAEFFGFPSWVLVVRERILFRNKATERSLPRIFDDYCVDDDDDDAHAPSYYYYYAYYYSLFAVRARARAPTTSRTVRVLYGAAHLPPPTPAQEYSGAGGCYTFLTAAHSRSRAPPHNSRNGNGKRGEASSGGAGATAGPGFKTACGKKVCGTPRDG